MSAPQAEMTLRDKVAKIADDFHPDHADQAEHALQEMRDALAAALSDTPAPASRELAWAVEQWNVQVKNRPLRNIHRRGLDDTWRQVIRYFGGDPVALIGPAHDDLVADQPPPASGTGTRGDGPDAWRIVWGPWIDWAGGECPLKVWDKPELRYRSGGTTGGMQANVIRWTHTGAWDDVLAYRIEQRKPAQEDAP